MRDFIHDRNKSIALFINDFDQKFADAVDKLSDRLGRPLRGVILVDEHVKKAGRNTPDKNGIFQQVVCDFSDGAALHAVLSAMRDELLLVTCSSEHNQPYLQKVLPHMPYLYGPTESSLEWSTHKAIMRQMLGSYDRSLVPMVHYIPNGSEDEISEALNKLSFPVIVKPTGLASSLLVSKVYDEAELRSVLAHGFDVIHDVYQREGGRGTPGFIVEEFIDGDIYSIDVYVNEAGKVWPLPFLRSKTAYSLGLEGFYIYQTDSYIELDELEIARGYKAAEQSVHALGLRSCVAHIELCHTPDGWMTIELGPRAGGQRQDIYYTAYGIDHAYNELLVKIGLEPELPTKLLAHCTTLNVYAEDEGIIVEVEGFDEALQNPSTYNLKRLAKVGDPARRSVNGGKVVVEGLMRHTNWEQLEKDAHAVRTKIKVKTR